MTKNFTISPRRLSFDLGRCDRCFSGLLNGEAAIDDPLPDVTSRIRQLQRSYCDGMLTSFLDSALPPGVIRQTTGVLSKPFSHQGVSLTIRGPLDAAIDFEDGTVGLISVEVVTRVENNGADYRAQVNAYRWALQNPGEGPPKEVSHAGVLLVHLDGVTTGDHGGSHRFSTRWNEIPSDPDWFTSVLEMACRLGANPTSAAPHPSCELCRSWRKT